MAGSYLTIGEVFLAFVLAFVAVRIANRLIRRMLGSMEAISRENRAAVHLRAGMLIRALTYFFYGVATVASISLALSQFGVEEARLDLRAIARWLLTHGLNIVIIIIGATIVTRAAGLAIEHLQHRVGRSHSAADLEWQRRASTIRGVLTKLVTVTVVFLAILMLLRELSIDIVPILTGAGIAGLAVGFGAQNLVRDVISGFFILLEDQIRVGDVARINNVVGSVEEIKLRTILIRDGEGAVHVFHNGGITALANMSKHFAYAVVDVRVAYHENMDRVTETIREVGTAMKAEAEWSGVLLEPIEIAGLESLVAGATVRAKFKVLPLSQGRVANELRRRLLSEFVRNGIRPYAPYSR
jgi:small conductance mechanosensitive channel